MMPQLAATRLEIASAITRLNALSPLDNGAIAALQASASRPYRFRTRREMTAREQPIREPLLILSGWAAHEHIFEDGRRQIIAFLLPGDVIGAYDEERPAAFSSVVALMRVEACIAPRPMVSPALARAYARSRSLTELQLSAQIMRIGRMSAQDRITDLLLELLDRLEVAGLAAKGRYTMPLTQEMIADAVGLTTVHVNRTLQALRREGAVDLKGRELILHNPDALRRRVGRPIGSIAAR